MVERIEELSAELHLEPFLDLEILEHGEVRIRQGGPTHDVYSGSSDCTDRIERECSGIEPLQEFLPTRPALIDAPVSHLICRVEVLTVERAVDAGAHRQ